MQSSGNGKAWKVARNFRKQKWKRTWKRKWKMEKKMQHLGKSRKILWKPKWKWAISICGIAVGWEFSSKTMSPTDFKHALKSDFFCHHRSQVMTESYWQMHACMFFFANISWNYGLYIIETLSVNHKVIVVEQNVRWRPQSHEHRHCPDKHQQIGVIEIVGRIGKQNVKPSEENW